MTVDFDAWFTLQFGKHPAGIWTKDGLEAAVARGEWAAAKLRAIELWEGKRTAARYAWTTWQESQRTTP